MKHFILLLITLISLPLYAQTAEEATTLHSKGREFFNAGKIIEGRAATKKAMDIRYKLFGEVNEDYITSLNNYALSYTMEENYDKAIELQNKVLALCAKLKTPHPNIGMYTMNMGRNYYLKGNNSQDTKTTSECEREAIKYWEQALPLVEKFGQEYELLLEWLSLLYSEHNNIPQIERMMQLIDEHNRHELTKDCNEPECMLERAEYYASIGDNVNAKSCFLKVFAMPMSEQMKLKAHEDYAKFLTNIEDFATSAEYYAFTAEIQKGINGKNEEYANFTYMAGIRFYLGKEYQKSIPYFQHSLEYYATINTPIARRNEVSCWRGMGNSFSAMKDYATAKEYYLKVMNYYENNDTNNVEYPKSIVRVATAEKFNKEYDASIAHYQQAMKIFDERNMTEEYSNAASSLQLCYTYAGKSATVDMDTEKVKAERHRKLDAIIQDELANLPMIKTYLGKLSYSQSLAVIAGSYQMKEDYSNAISYYKEYIPNIREAIRDEFRMQNATERLHLWDEELTNINMLRELLITMPIGNEKLMSELVSLVYDAELLSKGILLNSSIEFEKVLRSKNDSKMMQLYEKTKKNEEEINRLRNNASSETELQSLLALMQENQELQLKLYNSCAEYADFTNYISFTWNDVQQSMTETDIAIEFLAIDYEVFDADNYMLALVLTKDMTHPIAIPVCNLKQAADMVNAENLFEIDNLLWSAFDKYLEGKKRILFAADHCFNHIGIEYLSYKGKPLSEQYDVYRLSSTKEICKSHIQKQPTKVALFGDINYNDGAQYTAEAQRAIATLRGAGDAGVYANLDNTKKEVSEIYALFKNNNIEISMFTDTIASKTAFINLTDTKTNILHIATHGVYKENAKSSETESMNNSILVFAGANLTDNSLVTATEVANMNLRYCELAVLSACETGLGKLGNDGVFGLQRGFKNAGVQTILMSLKKVYDTSTAELMIKFYANLVEGQSKREALINAQKYIRTKGYNSPQHWASFILLDAFDSQK